MPGLALPQGGGFLEKGQQFMSGATNTYVGQRPKQETTMEPPGKTVGGALSAGAGMGLAGYTVGSTIGAGTAAGAQVGGGYGAAIGAAVGLLSYYLS